jgi:TP901 family phage tail tape measure protein
VPNYELGKAYGVIEINAASLGRTAAALDFVGNRMLAVGAVAAAAFGYAVKSAADFEEQMSRFKAVGNATHDQMEQIRQKALQLGRDSAYGATEVMKAFTELGYAGASTKEIVQGLGDATVYLAAAGEIPLAAAATTLINTMRQFGIEGKDAIYIADEIARATNASTITIDDMNTSLRYVGSTAAQMGIPFRDVAQAIAILGNEGIRGSTAGTSLRGVLVGLLASSGPAKEALHELGLDTNTVGNNFFTAEGKLRSFKDISEILRGALGGLADRVFDVNGKVKSTAEINALLEDSTVSLTDKTKLQAFAHLFQRRAMGAAFALAKEGAPAFDKLTESAQYNTTAQEIMRKKLDNLKGSLKKFMSSLENAAIALGEPMQKPLKEVTDLLKDLTNWFSKLSPKTQEIIMYALLAVAAFFLLGGALSKTIAMSIRSYKAFRDLAAGLRMIGVAGAEALVGLGPVGLILLAITLALIIIAVTAYFVYKNWNKIWNWIKDHPAYAILIAFLLLIIAPLLLIGFVVGALAKNWKLIWEKIKEWTKVAVDAIVDAWNWLKQAAQDVLDFFQITLVNFFKSLPGKMKKWATDAVNGFITFFNNLPFYIGVALGWVIAHLIMWAGELVLVMIDAAGKAVEFFGSTLEKLIPFVVELGLKILEQMAKWAYELATNLPGWLAAALEAVFNWSIKLWQVFIDLGIKILEKSGEWAMEFGPKIFSFLADIPRQMRDLAFRILGDFLEGLGVGVGGIDNWMEAFPGRLLSHLWGLAHSFWNAGWDAMQGFWNGLKALAETVKGWVSNFVDSMINKLTHPWDMLSPSKVTRRIGENIMKGMLQGLERTGPRVLDYLDTFGAQGPATLAAASVAAGGMGVGGASRISIDTVKIEVHGVSDPALARQVGDAAAEGFVGALTRRQLITTARVV